MDTNCNMHMADVIREPKAMCVDGATHKTPIRKREEEWSCLPIRWFEHPWATRRIVNDTLPSNEERRDEAPNHTVTPN